MSRERRTLDLAATCFFELFFSSATTEDIDGVTNLAFLSTAGGTAAVVVVVVVDPFDGFGGVRGALRLGPSSVFFFTGDLARLAGLFAAAGGGAATSVLRGRLLGDDMVLLLQIMLVQAAAMEDKVVEEIGGKFSSAKQ